MENVEVNENDCNEEGNNKKVTCGIILSFVGIIIEVISMGCTVSFGCTYDEPGSSLPA